jgi:hypothetical protein
MPRNIMSRRHFRRHALTGKPGGSTSLDLYFAAAGDTPTRPVWIRLSASPEPTIFAREYRVRRQQLFL